MSDDALTHYLADMGEQMRLAPRYDLADLVALYDAGGAAAQRARAALVQGHLALVVHIVCQRYKVSDRALALDLIQAGNLGLMHAAKKFEPHKGYRFTTYAVPWIRQNVSRALRDQDPLRRSSGYHERRARVRRAEAELRATVKPVTDEAVAARAKLTPKQMQNYREMDAPCVCSLDKPLDPGDESGRALVSRIPDARLPAPDARLEDAERAALLNDALDRLPARLELAVRAVYQHDLPTGLAGKQLGCSKPIVRERIGAALAALRNDPALQQLVAV